MKVMSASTKSMVDAHDPSESLVRVGARGSHNQES